MEESQLFIYDLKAQLKDILQMIIKESCMSQSDVSKILGVHKATVCRLMSPMHSQFKCDTMLRHIKSMGLDVVVLVRVPEGVAK